MSTIYKFEKKEISVYKVGKDLTVGFSAKISTLKTIFLLDIINLWCISCINKKYTIIYLGGDINPKTPKGAL